jgi:ribosomal protein S18 acetylase RimI-like enzyme
MGYIAHIVFYKYFALLAGNKELLARTAMIEQLSRKTLEDAKALVNSVFPIQTEKECSNFWLTKSLELSEERKKETENRKPKTEDPRLKTQNIPCYWVYIKDNKVTGIVGLYEMPHGKEACWLGWFCVDPNYRRQGIGSLLLDYAIGVARKRNKKYLRLYTTTDPNEADAQILYEKKGFKITKQNVQKRGPYDVFYRELRL